MVKAHPTDTLLLVLVLTSVIILVIFEATSQPSDVDVECFTPSHFDASQKEFAHRACSAYIWSADKRVNYDNRYLPLPGENKKLELDAVNGSNSHSKPLELYYWFIIETIIICAGYLITRLVTLCLSSAEIVINHVIRSAMKFNRDIESMEGIDGIPEKHDITETAKDGIATIAQGRHIFILYLIVELLSMIIWFGLSGKALIIQSDRQDIADANPNNVMCEFHLSKLGNNQRYVVQCQLPSMNNIAFVSMANTALCFTVAVFLLIHVLYTALIAPFLTKGPLDSILRAADIKPLSAAFSNLTLLTMLQDHSSSSIY